MFPVDLRSDTVTRPDAAMYEALRRAPLGDDVFGDDPSVLRLEEMAAEILGKQAALFVPSGTMGNSIAIAVQTRPGDEVLTEAQAHSLISEVGGGPRLWGVQMTAIPGTGGMIPLDSIRRGVKPNDIHLTPARLLILEQTSNLAGGRILPLDYLRKASSLARELGLRFHIDGARIFNAAVATGLPVREFAACADTVMFCLSKGLGAPVGSVLTGEANVIAEGRRVRKLLGGGLRQAGVLATCGIHALEHNVERLEEDHANARGFARAILEANLPGVEVVPPETNMVYVRVEGFEATDNQRLLLSLKEDGVWALSMLGHVLRFVFHKDISPKAAQTAQDLVIRQLEIKSKARK